MTKEGEGMYPGKAPWLHHLLQGGTCQSLCPSGDIQWVSGVWLHSSPPWGKLVQVLSLAASREEMWIKYSNTAEVHFDNEEVPAEKSAWGVRKAFKVAVAIFKEAK